MKFPINPLEIKQKNAYYISVVCKMDIKMNHAQILRMV